MASTQLKSEESKPTFGPPIRPFVFEANIFSQPWNDSDIVLLVGDKEFHVHRFILSFQSPVFKAMFTGNFKDATQDRIVLKDDNYEAMLLFLKLLYPPNTLRCYHKVYIGDHNIFKILEVADKYGAMNVIKQCIEETGNLKPENVMRLLPYAMRNTHLPCAEMFRVIYRHVSTEKLRNFAPQLDNDRFYAVTLAMKCRVLEDATKRANTMMLDLLQKYVEMAKKKDSTSRGCETPTPAKCVRHETLRVEDFKKARKCENCLIAYKKYLIEKYVYVVPTPSSFRGLGRGLGGRSNENPPSPDSNDLISLLELTDDIVTSLES